MIAVGLSFAGGFMLANSLNRSELNRLQAENESLKKGAPASGEGDENTLSDEEIRQRIAEADKNPENIEFQKNLGLALYQYAAMKRDVELLKEVSRLLKRAFEAKNEDEEVLTGLGNISFDIGYFNKDNEKLVEARKYYQQILSKNPENVEIRTFYGLTFFLTDPPEPEKAVIEFEKSLKTDPRNEKTLQAMTEVLISQNKKKEAEAFLDKLAGVNPNNSFLPELRKRLEKEN